MGYHTDMCVVQRTTKTGVRHPVGKCEDAREGNTWAATVKMGFVYITTSAEFRPEFPRKEENSILNFGSLDIL